MNSNTKQEILLGGKVVGEVRQDTFYRTLKQSHFLRRPPAIAQDTAVLDKLQALGVKHLEYRNSDSGTVYKTTLRHFQEAGFSVNRGFGAQMALRLSSFIVQGNGDHMLEPVYIEAAKPEAQQLSLFGGYR